MIGIVTKANSDIAEKAIQAASEAFESWKNVSAEERANIIIRAASIVRRRKNEFSALLVKEAGKPWKEADADTAEAIDFMEYYARQIIALRWKTD